MFKHRFSLHSRNTPEWSVVLQVIYVGYDSANLTIILQRESILLQRY